MASDQPLFVANYILVYHIQRTAKKKKNLRGKISHREKYTYSKPKFKYIIPPKKETFAIVGSFGHKEHSLEV